MGSLSNRRIRQRKRAEVRALAYLMGYRDEWRGAVEAGAELGVPYRPLAFAMRRLAAAGVIEEELIFVRGKHRSKETTRRYRYRTLFLPSWLPVVVAQPAHGRRVRGYASVR